MNRPCDVHSRYYLTMLHTRSGYYGLGSQDLTHTKPASHDCHGIIAKQGRKRIFSERVLEKGIASYIVLHKRCSGGPTVSQICIKSGKYVCCEFPRPLCLLPQFYPHNPVGVDLMHGCRSNWKTLWRRGGGEPASVPHGSFEGFESANGENHVFRLVLLIFY